MARLGYAVRGDHSMVRPRAAFVLVGALFFTACVDLTPKGNLNGAGGATGGTSVASGGAGGAGGTITGGNGTGGSSSDGGTTGVPLGGSGGVGGRGGAGGSGSGGTGSGGIGGGGGQGGIAGSISSAGGNGGSIDGPGFDRDAGGADVPQGGADGRTPDGGLDTGRDGGPDTREVGPSTPEIGPDTSDVGRDLGPDTPQDAPVDAVALPAGLVVYYPCESASGTTLPDQSGNGHNGTLSAGSPDGGAAPSGAGFAISSGGKIGNALTLAKAGYGYVSVPPVVFNGATAITIATWIKVTTAQNWARVFDIGVNAHINVNTRTGTKYFNLVPQNGSNPSQLEFAISINGFDPANQQVLHGTAIAPSNGWKHVAVTLDGSQGSLYVDGQLTVTDASVKLRPSDLGAIDYAYIGRSQFIADPYFDGQIDEFRVYNRALSATEIQTLAQFTGH